MKRDSIKIKQTVRTVIFILLFLVGGTYCSCSQSQKVNASSGGHFQNQSFSVAFTLGETMIQTLENSDKKVTQGFQQSDLIVTAIEEVKGFTFHINAYPNPVTNVINLLIDNELPEAASYSLFDMNGRLVARENMESLITKIPVQHLVSSTYFLKVMQGSTSVKTFKIIKK